MKRAAIAIPLVVLSFSASALAQEQPETPPPLPPPEPYVAEPPPRAPIAERFRVSGGLRMAYVHTHGFDTFADTNALPQLSIDGTYAFYNSGRFALAAGLGWDAGGRSSDLRGLKSSLTVHRFMVPVEARMTVLPWLWAFGKLAPGVALALADIEDPSAPRSLGASGWAFAADVSAGASFVLGKRPTDKRSVRVLLTPELGYAVTTAAPLHASPGRSDDELLGSDADTSLRSVALSGLFWRATVGLTF